MSQYYKDIADGNLYASRNSNDVAHVINAATGNRAGVDWTMTLRQGGPRRKLEPSASEPVFDLSTAARSETRKREPLTTEHPDGAYQSGTETAGKYQNYGQVAHMFQRPLRVSSGNALGIDWALNLRGGSHGQPDTWRRHFARSQKSFDLTKENCSRDNEAYQTSHITPQDRRLDRWTGAISIGAVRDDPISFRRSPGCEGTNVGQWEHLIKDRTRGHKSKRQLAFETTLRESKSDKHGARIMDNRSDGCHAEFLGKRRWNNHKHHDPLHAHPSQGGDPKLYHISRHRNLGEPPTEEERRRVITKNTRHKDELPEEHPGQPRRSAEEDGMSKFSVRSS